MGIMDLSLLDYQKFTPWYRMDISNGQKPDFTNELPFPDQPPPLPGNPIDFPSWFMVVWNAVKNSLNLLAARNAKIADFSLQLRPLEMSWSKTCNSASPVKIFMPLKYFLKFLGQWQQCNWEDSLFVYIAFLYFDAFLNMNNNQIFAIC